MRPPDRRLLTRYAFALLAAALLLAARPARAQTAPATVSLVPAELAGVVRDSAGIPIQDAEVLAPVIGKSTRTDRTGKFVLGGVVPGFHEVWVRRIGYVSVPFDWTAEEGKRVEIAVTLRLLPNTLDPVRVYASELKSLSSTSRVAGIVIDSAGLPVPRADVQLIGTSRTTVSAADGSFEFRHVPSGTMTLRARHLGFAPVALMIELGQDDQRDVTLRIRELATMLDTVTVTEASGYGTTDVAWRELGVRERWRSNAGEAPSIGPKRLAEAGGMPLDWFVRPYLVPQYDFGPTSFGPAAGHQAAKAGDPLTAGFQCILENGLVPRFMPLDRYLASDVERIEYYPPAPPEREYTSTVEHRMQYFPQCAKDERGRRPQYFVLWLKSAR